MTKLRIFNSGLTSKRFDKMFKRFGLVLISSVLLMQNASAQDGSTSFNFLNISGSTRIYGLGGVNISLVDDDITTADQNPALLGQEMSNQVSLNYMHYVGGSNFAGGRYAHSLGTHGTMAVGLQYYGYGSIKETDEFGNILGDFSPKDLCVRVGYSHDITDRLRGGIDLKFVNSSYGAYSSFAVATDLGINYYDSEKDLSLSVVGANLGGQLKKFDNKNEKLPIDLRLGWSQSFGNFPVRFSITAWNLTKWHLPYYEAGDGTDKGEFKKKDSFGSNLFRHLVFGVDLISSPNWHLGLGYNYKTRTDMSTYSRSFLSGFSLTGGIQVKSFGVGVAFAQPHTGATTFMLNLTMNINNLLN